MPSAVQQRLVTSASTPAHSSTSLKCDSGPPAIQLVLRVLCEDRRAVGVVQQAFDQVRGGGHVLQALLILDADGIAAEVVRDAHRRDVHLALLENLIER